MNTKEFPEAIEMEKQLLSAMFMKEGLVVPDVTAILDADDLYRPEHHINSSILACMSSAQLLLICFVREFQGVWQYRVQSTFHLILLSYFLSERRYFTTTSCLFLPQFGF